MDTISLLLDEALGSHGAETTAGVGGEVGVVKIGGVEADLSQCESE